MAWSGYAAVRKPMPYYFQMDSHVLYVTNKVQFPYLLRAITLTTNSAPRIDCKKRYSKS
jgi:hypothetical protein